MCGCAARSMSLPEKGRHLAEIAGRLSEPYPDEHELLARFTDLEAAVFYGPRFLNSND